MLDTASRFTAGKENESATWLQLYLLIHAPLKGAGVSKKSMTVNDKSDRGQSRSGDRTTVGMRVIDGEEG